MPTVSKTILVVDDSRPMRTRLKQICVDLGFTAFEAADGAEALRIMAEEPIDLVLTDWNMPKMDGRQFIDTVRKLPSLKNLPIILVTTESEKAKILDSLLNGAKDYIVKPFNEATVKQKIYLALGMATKK